MTVRKATRTNAKLRLALSGPAGAGKTFTAILMAKLLVVLLKLSGRVRVIDSERGSSEKYAQVEGKPEGPGNWDFDVDSLDEKNVQEYRAKIKEAADDGVQLLVIDSYSHSWLGALEAIDRMGGWVKGGKTISPLVAKLVDDILNYPGHVVTTMRSKAEHAIEKDEKTGRTTVRKVGMATVARDGTDFEFDVMLDLSVDGSVTVSKTRCSALAGHVYGREDIPKIAETLARWLSEGVPASPIAEMAQRIRFAQDAGALSALREPLNGLKATDPEGFRTLKPLYMARLQEFQA